MRRILTILGAALLVTVISADAFAQRGQGGNGNNGQNNGRSNGRSNGNSNGNGNSSAESVPGVPEIAIASGAGALALLAGGLLVLRGRRRS